MNHKYEPGDIIRGATTGRHYLIIQKEVTDELFRVPSYEAFSLDSGARLVYIPFQSADNEMCYTKVA